MLSATKATIPAWIDGRYVGLRHVLDRVGENDHAWWLDDFEGVTTLGGDLNSSQVGERLRRDGHIEFRWEALLGFAEHMDQMVNGRLSVREPGGGNGSAAIFTLEAFDSSEWIIQARNDSAWALAALSRITTRRG